MGGCVGGALGLNLSKAEKEALYNIGDVMGGDYEDDGYPTDNAISSEEELAQARKTMGEVIARLTDRDAISGELSISGKAEVEAEVKAEYSGSRTDLSMSGITVMMKMTMLCLLFPAILLISIGQDMGRQNSSGEGTVCRDFRCPEGSDCKNYRPYRNCED